MQTTTCCPQIIPLRANALRHPPLPSLHALLEGFFWDHLKLLCNGHFNGLYIIKTCFFFMTAMSFQETKKIQGAISNIEVSRTAVLFLPSNSRCSMLYCGDAAMIPFHTAVTSFLTLIASNIAGCPSSKCAG